MIWGAAILVVLSIAYIYKRSTDPLRARASYDAGERLYRIARYPQAILSLDTAIGYQGDFAEAYLLRGQARVNINEVDNAIQDFTRVIRLRPSDARAYLQRASAYISLKNYKAALGDCDQAILLDPRLSAAQNIKGTVVRGRGNAREALSYFNRALELEENLDNYFQRGATYQALGQHRQAIADLDQAIHFSPYSAHAYFARAESKRALGDEAGAKQDHRQGRILDGR